MPSAPMMGFFNDVGIVTSPFDHAGVGAVSSTFGASLIDFSERIN